MPISQRTVGLLIDYVASTSSQGNLASTLMKHNLSAGDPGPDDRPFSRMPVVKRVTTALEAAMKAGQEDDLLSLAQTALRDREENDGAPEWVRELLVSLRADGFTCTPRTTEVPAASMWAAPTTETRWTITPLGYSELPVATLSSDLSQQLVNEGFAVAAGHYDQALAAFHRQDWAASNSQLRTTFESVVKELLTRRTGAVATGGGAAINALQTAGALVPGQTEYLRGLWSMSHPQGSHPGLSNEQDAQHRVYAISAAVSWLVHTLA
ncbi:hypothetical protein [Microbacterium gorillae]|uniref:hypothetical protein n=1 Tax=Microbacterium gorillae TaxID=1231063 RepID=UPI003D989AF5